VVRCFLEGTLVASRGTRVARRDEMGRSWPDISLRNEKKTLVANAATPQGAQPVLGSRAIEPWSEMRPNRISTGSWVPATVTWALTSGDQLCPASAAGRNGATSPTVALESSSRVSPAEGLMERDSNAPQGALENWIGCREQLATSTRSPTPGWRTDSGERAPKHPDQAGASFGAKRMSSLVRALRGHRQ
jgi:hypothetical protein